MWVWSIGRSSTNTTKGRIGANWDLPGGNSRNQHKTKYDSNTNRNQWNIKRDRNDAEDDISRDSKEQDGRDTENNIGRDSKEQDIINPYLPSLFSLNPLNCHLL